MILRYFHIITFLIIVSFPLLCIPPALAGGSGAGFGDYGDFGVDEGARMAADPHYPGLMAGSTNLSKPTVMTPLPTVTPQTVNATANSTTNVSARSNVTLNATSVVRNSSVNMTEGSEDQSLTKYSSVGDIIKAGDWKALDAYNAKMKADNAAFFSEDVMNQKFSQRSPASKNDDDTITTVVYPCT